MIATMLMSYPLRIRQIDSLKSDLDPDFSTVAALLGAKMLQKQSGVWDVAQRG